MKNKRDITRSPYLKVISWLYILLAGILFLFAQSDLQRVWAQEKSTSEEGSAAAETRAIAADSRSRLLDQNRGGIESLWSEWYEALEELADHELKQDDLPDFSWFSPLSENKESNLKKIKELSERLLIAFKNPKVERLRSDYFELKEKIDSDLKAARQAAEDSYHAPEDGEGYFWESHRSDYLELKKKKEEAVKEYRVEQQRLISQCHDALLDMGIELTPKQVEQLFRMSEGDLMLTLFSTFAQLNLLGDYVTERMSQARDDADYAYLAKKYYAVYVAIISLSHDIHTYTRQKLLTDHLKKLDKLRGRLKDVMGSTQKLVRAQEQHIQTLERTMQRGTTVQQQKIAAEIQEARAHLEQLRTNYQVQQRAQEGASAYREHIVKQAAEIKIASEKIHRRLRIAFNTYQTVLIGTDQFDLMREGLRDLSNLQRVQIPAMVPLAGERITDHLEMITRHFSGDETVATPIAPQSQFKR